MLPRSSTLDAAQFCVVPGVNLMTGGAFGCRKFRVPTSVDLLFQRQGPAKAGTLNSNRQSHIQNLESLRAASHRNLPLDPGRVHTCGTSLRLRAADRLPDALYLV